jgi:hypothetical protein
MSKLVRNHATITLIDTLDSNDLLSSCLLARERWEALELAMLVYLLIDRTFMSVEELLTVNFYDVADHVNGCSPDAAHIDTMFFVNEPQLALHAMTQYNMQTGGRKMYLHSTLIGDDGRRFCETTLKLDPEKYNIGAVNRVEVYGTDIDDPGEDYCEFRVIDSEEKTIAVRREMGY